MAAVGMNDKTGQQIRVWALLGPHRGDNNQVLALAEALGLPFEEKWLEYNQLRRLQPGLLGATLKSVAGDARVSRQPVAAAERDGAVGVGRCEEVDPRPPRPRDLVVPRLHRAELTPRRAAGRRPLLRDVAAGPRRRPVERGTQSCNLVASRSDPSRVRPR